MHANHDPLKVLAVGAAGPSASLVVPELLKRNVSVRAFVHKQEDEPIVRTGIPRCSAASTKSNV